MALVEVWLAPLLVGGSSSSSSLHMANQSRKNLIILFTEHHTIVQGYDIKINFNLKPLDKQLVLKCSQQIITIKSKSSIVVEHQRIFTVYKTTSDVKGHFKSSATPLYCWISDLERS